MIFLVWCYYRTLQYLGTWLILRFIDTTKHYTRKSFGLKEQAEILQNQHDKTTTICFFYSHNHKVLNTPVHLTWASQGNLNQKVMCKIIPADIYSFEVRNGTKTRTMCETFSKLKIKTLGRRSGVFIINLEHISRNVLVFPLLSRNK